MVIMVLSRPGNGVEESQVLIFPNFFDNLNHSKCAPSPCSVKTFSKNSFSFSIGQEHCLQMVAQPVKSTNEKHSVLPKNLNLTVCQSNSSSDAPVWFSTVFPKPFLLAAVLQSSHSFGFLPWSHLSASISPVFPTMKCLSALHAFIFASLPLLVASVDPYVDLTYNKYIGQPLPSRVTQWLGMRFATPPILRMRFSPPADPYKTTDAPQVLSKVRSPLHGPISISISPSDSMKARTPLHPDK